MLFSELELFYEKCFWKMLAKIDREATAVDSFYNKAEGFRLVVFSGEIYKIFQPRFLKDTP